MPFAPTSSRLAPRAAVRSITLAFFIASLKANADVTAADGDDVVVDDANDDDTRGSLRAQLLRVALDGQWLNLRIGATAPAAGFRPTLCAEVAPLPFFSTELCGNGSGFLHADGQGDLAHFRTKLRAPFFDVGAGFSISPQLGVGFAELEVGADGPGFVFGAPTTSSPGSVAGPEAMLGLQARYALPFGFDALGNLSLGAAYFHYAPELVRPQARVQPFAGVELGVGW